MKADNPGVPAEELDSIVAIRPYLCFWERGKNPMNKTIEKRCAGCENRCAYGQRWLDLYWGAQDEAWEKEQEKKRVAREVAKLHQLRQELYAIRSEKKAALDAQKDNTPFLRTVENSIKNGLCDSNTQTKERNLLHEDCTTSSRKLQAKEMRTSERCDPYGCGIRDRC